MTGKKMKEGQDGDGRTMKKVQLKKKVIKTHIQLVADGETVKNEKWINGDHHEIKMIGMATNVGKEIEI